MTTDCQTPAKSSTPAATLLADYAQRWFEQTINECHGRESAVLLALVRVADLHALRMSRMYPMREVNEQVSYRIGIGAGLLLAELLAHIAPGTALRWQSTPAKLATWVTQKLEQAGALAIASRLAVVAPYGLSTCVMEADDVITVSRGPVDDQEEQEDADRNWVNGWDKNQAGAEWYAANQAWSKPRGIPPDFNTLLGGYLVLPAPDDERFKAARAMQSLNALEYPESESFPDSVKLGPLTFGQWKGIAVSIAGVMLVEAGHAVHAGRVHQLPPLGQLNLLGRFLDEKTSAAFIRQCCPDLDDAGATEVLGVFAADCEDRARFRDRFDFASPLLIKVAGGYLFTQKGPIDNPYWYLTDKLKTCYAKDWEISAANVALRETPFRVDLHRLFNHRAYAIGKANLKLRRTAGQQGTDIDATIFERETNIVYLFQLKWPDVYARDWRPRESQASNLRASGLKWIKEVNSWLERDWTLDPKAVLTRLELHRLVADPSKIRFRLVMLSRSWTRFSRKAPYDGRAAWTSWTRLRRLIIECQYPHASLDAVWPRLSTPLPVKRWPTTTSTTRLPGLTLHFDL